ncbi:MAG: carboxypeptidase regulatory-like domain-containing protein [Vicinamibacterales bacterium]
MMPAGGVLLIAFAAATGLMAEASSAKTQRTGTLAGQVRLVTPSASEPVPGAVVSATGTRRALSFQTVTDREGRFRLTDLPADSYELKASRPPHVAVTFGADRAGWPGTRIALEEGGINAGLTLEMVPGAVIAGVVRDSNGRPQAEVPVQIERRTPRGLMSAGRLVTDDRGAYRAFGLASGTYIVSAQPRQESAQVAMPSDAETEAALRWLRSGRRDPPPGFVVPDAPTAPGVKLSMAPAYFADAWSSDTARAVDVHSGAVTSGVDLTLRYLAMPRLTGRLSGGSAAERHSIVLHSFQAPEPMRTASLSAAGRFDFGSVVPGDYVVVVRQMRPERMTAVLAGHAVTTPTGDETCFVGAAATALAPGSNPDIVVPLERCFSAAARVSGTTADMPPVTVRLASEVPALSSRRVVSVSGASQQMVAAPGEFAAGRFRVVAHVTADGPHTWLVSSVQINGVERSGQVHYFAPGSEDQIVVTATRSGAAVEGRLEAPDGQAATDYTVLVFPDDPQQWEGTAFRQRGVRPDSRGRFGFGGLPPGDYLLAAARGITADEWLLSDVLREMAPAAIRLSLGAGEVRSQDLRITR